MKDLEEPWLIAAWPGMGAIAQIAGSYLLQHLDADEVGELPTEGFFEAQAVDVEDGLATRSALPSNRLFAWKHPDTGRDLLLFLGEQQPATDGYRFCLELVRKARELGAVRIVTFAAMAAQIAPQADPRVLGAANTPELLAELRAKDVEIMGEGQIGGLNGLLLAAASEEGMEAFCLLGEFPYYANAMPNPKSSAAVLTTFAELAGTPLDLEPLREHGRAVERGLVEHLHRLQQAVGGQTPQEAEAEEYSSLGPDQLDPEVEERIESLFRQAQKDRSKALELKAELDRQGVFKRYEDRFLDLFKQAE